MADRRIWTTADFAKRKAVGAKIICTSCRHSVSVSPAVLKLMFPVPLPVNLALERLKCSNCGAKKADFLAIRAPER